MEKDENQDRNFFLAFDGIEFDASLFRFKKLYCYVKLIRQFQHQQDGVTSNLFEFELQEEIVVFIIGNSIGKRVFLALDALPEKSGLDGRKTTVALFDAKTSKYIPIGFGCLFLEKENAILRELNSRNAWKWPL